MADGANRSGGVGDDPAPQEASRETSPRAFGSLSDEERKRLLTRKVFELTRENRAALRSQTDFEAVLIRGKATNHLLMFVTLAAIMAVTALAGRLWGDPGLGALAAILVGGLFAMAWLVMALTGGEEIERLTIDRQGAIASAKSGRSVDARGDFIRIAGPTIVLVICAFLAISLTRDIVNPPPPNCTGNPTATKDTDACLALPNLGTLLGGPTVRPTATPSPTATASGAAASGSSASAGPVAWSLGSEKLVERLIRSLQLLLVIVVAVVTSVFLGMMLAGEWVFGIRPVRRRGGRS